MKTTKNELLRKIPPVNELIEADPLKPIIDKYPRSAVVEAARNAINEIRDRIKGSSGDQLNTIDLSINAIAQKTAELAQNAEKMNLRRVINATGIILNTGLGRAFLADKAR